MSLSVEQIEVVSFETAVSDGGVVAQPITAPTPNCYSPLCIPTDLPEQCPDKTTVITG
jgi:hypothetical protein